MATSTRRIMPKRVKGYRAWLVRWEWAGDHARVEHPVVAVLSPQTGTDEVRKFVERYYAATTYPPDEQLAFMRQPGTNPYRAEIGTTTIIMENGVEAQIPYGGLIICGHNPHIVATQVSDLRAIDKEPGLSWNELPRPVHDLRKRTVQE